MNINKMLCYESPKLDVLEIQLEEGIVRTSTEIKPEENGIPQISDWVDEGDISGDFEL